LDQIGPITKSVEDARTILSWIEGEDGKDSNCIQERKFEARGERRENIKGLKVGVPREYFSKGLDSGVREIVEKALEVSRKSYDRALGELVAIRQEIEKLKEELEELKKQEQISDKDEIGELKKEIEELKKQIGGQKLQPTPFKTQEIQQKTFTPAPTKKVSEEYRLTITYTTPNKILNNIGAVDVTIIGTGFKKGVIVDIGIVNKPITTFINDKEINARIPGSLIPGNYNLIVINSDGESTTLRDALTIIEPPKVNKSDSLSGPEIASKVKPSVILIETTQGHGSGFLIDGDGFILTNAHVVKGYQTVSVKLDNGSKFNGIVVGRDEIIDLAIVKVSSSGLSPVILGSSNESSLPLSSEARAFGYPFVPSTLTIEQGEITARRVVDSIEYLQTSANIQPGNSGGPLVNNKAEAIGINTWGITIGGVGIGFNFAIPIDLAKQHIPKLKSGSQVLEPTSTPPPSTSTSTPAPTVPGTLSALKAPDSPSSRAFYWGQNDTTFTKIRFTGANEGIFVERLTITTDDSISDFNNNVDSIKVSYKNKSGSTLTTIGSSNAQGNTSFAFTGDSRPYIPKDSSIDLTVSANLKTKAQNATQGVQFSANLIGGQLESGVNAFRAVGESTGTVISEIGTNSILGTNHIIYRAFPEFIQESLTAGSPVGTKDVLKFTTKAHGLSDSSIIFDNDTSMKFEILASGTGSGTNMTTRIFDTATGEQYASAVVSDAQSSLSGNRTSIVFDSWDKAIEIDGGSQKTFRIQISFTNFTDKNDFFQLVLQDRNSEFTWKSNNIVQSLVPGFIRLLPIQGPIFVQP
ncbi:MAG: trypsin-like peptidase domain-containing protein, partial [Parcubacteria group bacterium]|nr:trypsin-like peptidase domain-containing protein [Parcubacteria group bacterium]